jgi:hypothetical protein
MDNISLVKRALLKEERNKEYAKYNVPLFIRKRASLICDIFAIEYPTDSLYIANIIAKALGCGNGHNVFTYEQDSSNFLEIRNKTIDKPDAEAICDRIISVYGESFYDIDISREVLLGIIVWCSVTFDDDRRLLNELIPLTEREHERATDSWWKGLYADKLETLRRRAKEREVEEKQPCLARCCAP